MKKALTVFLVMMLLFGLTACGSDTATPAPPQGGGTTDTTSQAPAGVTELRMSQASAEDGAIGQAMEYFAGLIYEMTEGRFVINTFHNAQLGSERDNVEQCQLGTLDIAVVNQAVLGNFVPDISVLDLPYVIDSYEHADRVFQGEIGTNFLEMLSDVGLFGLSIWESGFRNLTNSRWDVYSIDDVAGLRISVMENQIHQDLWRALGADPVPMAWSDAFTALQQGAIDGQENPATVIDRNNVIEVNDRMAITQHVYSTVFLIMAPQTWNALSPEDQAIFRQAAAEAGAFGRILGRQMGEEALETLESQGMTITWPDRSGFIEASQSVRDTHGERFHDILLQIEALR